VEWCRPNSKKADIILHRIFRHDPDVICLTEAHLGFLPDSGHIAAADSDYGYKNVSESRRKVLLWSKMPWSDMVCSDDKDMPGGRYLAAETETPLGRIFCRGVCIPWSGAHVNTGRRDRSRWQDHDLFLEALARIRSNTDKRQEIVVGDYNQRIPRKYQPRQSFRYLASAIEGLRLGTEGLMSEEGKPAIDHIAHSHDLVIENCSVISNLVDRGTRLSDHFGIHAVLTKN